MKYQPKKLSFVYLFTIHKSPCVFMVRIVSCRKKVLYSSQLQGLASQQSKSNMSQSFLREGTTGL